MPAVTYNEFSGGLDRRLSINSQDANKLWSLKDAYVTLAKRLKKRPGLRLVTTGLAGSYGLESVSGSLKVFCDTTAVFVPPVVTGLPIDRVNLDIPPAGSTLDRVYYADLFQGFIYVVARYASGYIKHHYVDGKSATVTISNATPAVVTWAAHGLTVGSEVKFSTTGALPSPLVAGTTYYIIAAGFLPGAFQISATLGGVAINTTTAGSGVHTGTTATYISDPNCPHTNGITKAASRVFAPSAENARYTAAGNARDWTTASDAGFLPAGLQQDTKGTVKACGTFQDSLVVFFDDSAQIWAVAVDPTANAISKRIFGVGTVEPISLASFFNDLVFLSPFGFRSMTVQAQTNRIDDSDVGVPVDSLVKLDIETLAGTTDPEAVLGVWIAEFGQYWAFMDLGSSTKVWVYTFSRSSKIACWSEYFLPIEVKAVTTRAGKVYLRSADSLYEADPAQYTDNNTLINVEIQMAFQDAKSPGVAKQVYGADYVTEGTPSVSFKYDPRDISKESIPMVIPGDTRPGDVMPVEIVAPAIAPVFRHSLDEAMSIDAVTLYFNSLGTV